MAVYIYKWLLLHSTSIDCMTLFTVYDLLSDLPKGGRSIYLPEKFSIEIFKRILYSAENHFFSYQ